MKNVSLPVGSGTHILEILYIYVSIIEVLYMDEMFGDAIGMAATGVGLGILTIGAMVPITMMQKMANEPTTKKKTKKTMAPKITMPKLQF
jgi:hypothetical protein